MRSSDAFVRARAAQIVYVSLCDAEQRAFAWAPVDLTEGDIVAVEWPSAPASVVHWMGFLDVHGVTLWWQSALFVAHDGVGACVAAPRLAAQ